MRQKKVENYIRMPDSECKNKILKAQLNPVLKFTLTLNRIMFLKFTCTFRVKETCRTATLSIHK